MTTYRARYSAMCLVAIAAGSTAARAADDGPPAARATAPPPAAMSSGEPAADADAADADAASGAARQAFREGTALARDGHWSDALLAFERSASLHPHTVTDYNIAYCERALGRYARARQLFAKALADDARLSVKELPRRLADEAQDYVAELDRKLAHVIVVLSPEDAALSVDGSAPVVASVETGRVKILVLAGTHRLLVSKRGYRDGLLERAFVAGETATLALRAGELITDAAGAADSAHRPSRVPMYLALGAGAVGLAVGVTAGVVALRNKAELNGSCADMVCRDEQGSSALRSARAAADISTIGFVAAASGLAAGAVLWVVTQPASADPSTPARSATVALGVWPPALLVKTAF